MNQKGKIGKDAVVIGEVDADIGDGSVVIRPTDGGGISISGGTAIGRDARADSTTVAIGAGANSGSELFHLIDQLRSTPELRNEQRVLDAIDALKSELQKSDSSQDVIDTLWSTIQGAASVGGAADLFRRIGAMLFDGA